MLVDLKETKGSVDEILNNLDKSTLKLIENEISKLHDKTDQSLALLKETKASIEARRNSFSYINTLYLLSFPDYRANPAAGKTLFCKVCGFQFL